MNDLAVLSKEQRAKAVLLFEACLLLSSFLYIHYPLRHPVATFWTLRPGPSLLSASMLWVFVDRKIGSLGLLVCAVLSALNVLVSSLGAIWSFPVIWAVAIMLCIVFTLLLSHEIAKN